ncbi:MAG: MFS transporter [Spirochaetales bacterium]|nr:MFS transporter [Spirochaetales bacterium]
MENREKRNIILSVAGMSVSRLGSLIYTFAIGLYVLKLTGSGQSFGVTLMLGILPRVLLGPFAGNFADRMNKKALIVGSDLFSGILMMVLYSYTLKGNLTLPLIYGTTLLLSISSVLLDSTFGAAQRDIVRLESLTKLGSLRQSLDSIINLASPMIGGVIYTVFPISAFLLINGISFLMSSASEYFIDFNFNKSSKEPAVRQSFFKDMKSGFTYTRKDNLLIGIGLSALMLNFFLSSLGIIIPLALVQQMGIEEQLYGLSTSIISLGALFGAVIIGRKNSRLTRNLMIRSLVVVGICFTLIGVAMHSFFGGSYFALILITLFGFLLMVSVTFVNVPIGVFFQIRVDPAYLGRVSSIIGSVCLGIMPIAYILYGFLSELYSPFLILTISGSLNIVIVIIMALSPVFRELDEPVLRMEAAEEPA